MGPRRRTLLAAACVACARAQPMGQVNKDPGFDFSIRASRGRAENTRAATGRGAAAPPPPPPPTPTPTPPRP